MQIYNRQYFQYYYIENKFRVALVASVLFHFLAGIFIPWETKNNSAIVLNITIEKTTNLATGEKSQFSRTFDKKGNKEISQTRENILKNSLFAHDKILKEKKDKFLPEDIDIVESYHSKLATKNIVNSPPEFADKNLKSWVEDRSVTTSQKSKTSESIRIPGGKADTVFLNWTQGHQRKLIYKAPIDYPDFFRKQGIQASVRLKIDIDSLGNIVNITVIKSSGYSKLDLIAKNGVRKSKFSPRTNEEKRKWDSAEMEVIFKLDE